MFNNIKKFFLGPGMMDDSDDGIDDVDGEEEKDPSKRREQERYRPIRQHLVAAIVNNDEAVISDTVGNVLETESSDFSLKYALLDVKLLIDLNSQSVNDLKSIVPGLSTISKYAQHLLKKNERPKLDIPLSNSHVRSKILPLNGSRDILAQLGYAHQTETTFSFLPQTSPDKAKIANLLADMLLFKAELRYYFSGSHLSPQQINTLLPQSTVLEIHQGGEAVSDTPDMSMQSFDVGKESKDEKGQNASSGESSPYVSALSGGGSHKDSTEAVTKDENLPDITENCDVSDAPPTVKLEGNSVERPTEIVTTMQDFTVQENSGSESTSLRTPSSGFRIPCSLCNEEAQTICKTCLNKLLCENCDLAWHGHPARRNHPTTRVSEVDLAAMPGWLTQENIVEGPYGIIAQTENPAALIGRKMQAAADRPKKEVEMHNGPVNPVKEGESAQGGNMPDLGSLMSEEGFLRDKRRGSTPLYDNDQRNPQLISRGGSQEEKRHPLPGRDLGSNVDPDLLTQQQQQYQELQQMQQRQNLQMQQMNQQLPQFLQQENAAPVSISQGATMPQPLSPSTMYPGPQTNTHNVTPMLVQTSSGNAHNYMHAGRVHGGQGDNIPTYQHYYMGQRPPFPPHQNATYSLIDVNGQVKQSYSTLQHPYQNQHGQRQDLGNTNHNNYYGPTNDNNNKMLADYQTSHHQGDHRVSLSLNPQYQDKDQTYVQYSDNMKTRNMSMMDEPRLQHQIPPTPSHTFMPKQSQTYPQLSAMSGGNPNNRPDMPRRSVSSSSSALSNPALKFMKMMKSEPTSSHRSLCRFKIKELSLEIQDLQQEIDDLIVEDEEAYSSEIDYKSKRKKELLKFRKELDKISKEMDIVEENDEEEIYYPPSVPHVPVYGEEKIIATGRRSPVKERHDNKSSTQHHVALMGHENKLPSPPSTAAVKHENKSSSPVNTQGIKNENKSSSHHNTAAIVDNIKQPRSFVPNVPEEDSIIDNRSRNEIPSNPVADLQLNLKSDKSMEIKWQCQHCTFLNDLSLHACMICNKTSEVKMCLTEDGIPVDMEFVELRGLQDTIAKRRILEMQQEEEKMVAEKKKALKEFDEKNIKNESSESTKVSPPSSSQSKSHKGEAANADTTTGLPDSQSSSDTGGSANSSTSTPSSSNASLALWRLKDAQTADNLRKDGEFLVRLMKRATTEGFNPDAVPIALSFYDSQTSTVMDWVANNWEKNLNKIVKEVTDRGATRDQNSIGKLSLEEAESACIECHGNIKNAIDLCVKKREDLFHHLNDVDTYPREEILQVMLTQRGDRVKAERELIINRLQAFVERIWSDKGDARAMNALLYPAPNPAPMDVCNSVASSALGHDNFQRLIMDKDVDRDRRIRMILVEGKMKSWGRGELVIDILDSGEMNEHVTLEDIVEAVRNCRDRKSALALLQQECSICLSEFPMGKIQNLSFCQCKLCGECLIGNFTVVIKEKHVRHWTCPICSLPDMNDEEASLDHLNILQMLLSPVVEVEVMNLFEDKLRDFSLQKDPSFRWCSHCGTGFLAAGLVGALTCPHCRNKTCFHCKRMWEPQHEGLTCAQFEQWKIDNDPNNQAIGLARHLEENGIDCPKCKMRYSLAKGGCMHFKCPQCGHEYCSGCYENFLQKGVCKKYKGCENKGLHCHHPRDCFYFLRDTEVKDLQKLLETNKVPFNVQVPEDQEDKEHCPVMEQKEIGVQRTDEMCGKDVPANMAGLCISHYKEYLTSLINKHALDPIVLLDLQQIVALLQRFDIKDLPCRGPNETDEGFKALLIKLTQQRLPLQRKKFAK